MKRLSLLGFVGLLSSILAGCPIFNEDHRDGDCRVDEGCTSPGTPSKGGCKVSSDCAGPNETCGQDSQCHPGDCTVWGCSAGSSCTVDPNTETASCTPGAPASDTIWCGNPKDCAAGLTCAPNGTCQTGGCAERGCIYGFTCSDKDVCVRTNPAGCGVDADCVGAYAGYACVSGICTAPSDQCFDQTQCAAGSNCVAGKCTPGCAASASACGEASGYACDTSLGTCTKPVKGCKITNECGGPSLVCVDSACVPRSEGPKCPAGAVWVDNGCVADQSASFTCKVDGVQDECSDGSICLHRSCYISCDAPNATVCDKQPALNLCKSVTSSSGMHNVCGSKQNFGGQCDPTAKIACEGGKICIDGFCK